MSQRTLVLGALLLIAAAAFGQDMPAVSRNTSQMKMMALPVFPTCASVSIQNGDPATGPSISYAKIKAGCVFPWHWHTPSEHIMMVSGTAKLEMKDGKPVMLHAGGYALMPGHHVHQATCTTACTMYVYGDGAFDMHYVDAAGKELSPADALKSVHEKPPAESK